MYKKILLSVIASFSLCNAYSNNFIDGLNGKNQYYSKVDKTIYEKESNNKYYYRNVKTLKAFEKGKGNLYIIKGEYDNDFWKFIPKENGTLEIYVTDSNMPLEANIYLYNKKSRNKLQIIDTDKEDLNNYNFRIKNLKVLKGKKYYISLKIKKPSGFNKYKTYKTNYNLYIVFIPEKFEITNDNYTINPNETLKGNVLKNDRKKDINLINDSNNKLVVVDNTTPKHGILVIEKNGNFTYKPNKNFEGIDTFTYTVEDKFKRRATAKVTIAVIKNIPLNQGGRNFILRKSFNIRGDFKMIGNTVLCDKVNGKCIDTNLPNNDLKLSYTNVLNGNILNINGKNIKIINSSKAKLVNIPENAKILWVGFYTQGDIKDSSYSDCTQGDIKDSSYSELSVKLKTHPSYLIAPNGDKYEIYPELIDVYKGNPTTFSTFAEIKQLEGKSGKYFNGWWTGVNIQTEEGKEPNLGYFGAWNLVIVYQDNNMHLKNISVFDGYKRVTNRNDVHIDLKGFLTPLNGNVNSEMAVFVGEGDKDFNGDKIFLNGKNLNIGTNKVNNAFDSTTNGFDKMPDLNNNFGIDIHNYNIGTNGLNIIKNGEDSAQIELNTTNDIYYPSVIVFSTDLYEPRICYYINDIKDDNGNIIYKDGIFNGKITNGENYIIDYSIANLPKNSNDNVETAKNVKIFTKFKDFEYKLNTTKIRNVDENKLNNVTDKPNDDIFTYLSSDNEFIYNIGKGANSNQGGTILPYQNVNIQLQGKFNFTNATSNKINLANLIDIKATFQNNITNVNEALPIPKCVNFNTEGNIYIPKLGSFNVVEQTFNQQTDPTDIKSNVNAIKTKIVNKPFSVKIISLDEDYTTLKPYLGLIRLDLINNPSNENECNTLPALKSKFIIFANNYFMPSDSVTSNFVYNKALKNGRFRIKYLIDPNGNMLDFANCQGNSACIYKTIVKDILSNMKNASVCMKSCMNTGMNGNITQLPESCLNCIFEHFSKSVCSRDNFAIRPDHFVVSGTVHKVKAGEYFNLVAKAVDAKGNVVPNYNISDSSLEFNVKNIDGKKVIDNGKFNNLDNIKFNSGIANINNITYSEVNNLAFKLQEKVGQEFAKVDAKDTPLSERLIKSNIPYNIRFIPYKLVAEVNLSNGQKNKTYLSNGTNYGKMIITVKAENKNGGITQNYSNGLYANNVDVNVVLNSEPIDTIYLNGKKVKEIFNKISKSKFDKGSAKIEDNINFAKDYTTPIKPFNLSIKEVKVKDNDVSSISNNVNGNIYFVYGKLSVSNKTIKDNTTDLPLQVLYYNSKGKWIIDKDYNNKVVKNVLFTPPLINLNSDTMKNGIETLNITYNGSTYPQTIKAHIDIPEYLWQSNFGLAYKAPSVTNYNCNTHPCAIIEFIKDTGTNNADDNVKNSKWLGIKSEKNSKGVSIIQIAPSDKVFYRIN